jgi:hypothetical protein
VDGRKEGRKEVRREEKKGVLVIIRLRRMPWNLAYACDLTMSMSMSMTMTTRRHATPHHATTRSQPPPQPPPPRPVMTTATTTTTTTTTTRHDHNHATTRGNRDMAGRMVTFSVRTQPAFLVGARLDGAGVIEVLMEGKNKERRMGEGSNKTKEDEKRMVGKRG